MKILVESFSEPETFYSVIFHVDGSAECGCPHWQFRLRHRVAIRNGVKYAAECKHIQDARPYIQTARDHLAVLGDSAEVSLTVTKEMR
jgi:hypothetical protein